MILVRSTMHDMVGSSTIDRVDSTGLFVSVDSLLLFKPVYRVFAESNWFYIPKGESRILYIGDGSSQLICQANKNSVMFTHTGEFHLLHKT